jgi:penicillin-binding protein 1A
MRNILRPLLQNRVVQSTGRVIHYVWQPIATGWNYIMTPVRRVFHPVIAPVTARWHTFATHNPRLAFVLGWMGTLMRWGITALLLLIISVWVGLWGRLPNKEDLRNLETANATEVYTIDSVLIGKFFIENRTTISLDKISPYVVTALLATEDKRFFEHSGIDMMSWLRVFKGVASSQSLGGGSTLSQQLAKNLYPRRNYYIPGFSIFINKLRENFISVRLEDIYNKEQLVSLYLNTVPFGGDRYGINVASRYFFNKKPKDLTADQSATLIGMLKASTFYDPIRNPENAKKRRNLVLRQMVKNKDFTFESPDKALAVVANMVQNGKLSEKECEELLKKPVGAKRYGGDGNNDGAATYFREHLRTEVMPKLLKNYQKPDGTSYNLYRDGLKIYTTLHSKMQQYAEEAVQKHMQTLQKTFDQHWKNYKQSKPWGDDKWIDEQVRRSERWENLETAGMSEKEIIAEFEKPAKMTVFSWKGGGTEADTILKPIDSVRYYFCLLNCGFMAMEHKTGYVRAWVGGTNFRYFKFDHIKSSRQVGSTFKPIVYAAALQDSIKPCQYFKNQITKIVDWEPHNADESYGGYCSVLGGLTYSVNVIAAQLIEKVGIEHTIQLAKKMGVTSTLRREFGISLGAAEISLFDMMKVYGTMANGGKRPEPTVVLRVLTRKNEVIYDYKEELQKDPELGPHEQALSPEHAAMMTRMLQSVIDHGTGRKMRYGFGLQIDLAGKTGTTQDQSDGWFICYNPTLVTGAWVGAESPAVRFRAMELGQGSSMALPISAWFWHKLANAKERKLADIPLQKFEPLHWELQAKFGCPFRLYGVTPDSFNIMMRDTTIRDSMRANGFRNLREAAEKFFGKPTTGEPEPPIEEKQQKDQYDMLLEEEQKKELKQIEKQEKKQEKEERKEERQEKRKDFFDKLLGKKPGEGGGN